MGRTCDERGTGPTAASRAGSSSAGSSTTGPGSIAERPCRRRRRPAPSATSIRSVELELLAASDLEVAARRCGGRLGRSAATARAAHRRRRGRRCRRRGGGRRRGQRSRPCSDARGPGSASRTRCTGRSSRISCSSRCVASSMRQVEDRRREGREVGLDGGLVLARRRDDPGGRDPARLVELVAMEEQAARRLGRPGRDARAGLSRATAGAPAAGSRR